MSKIISLPVPEGTPTYKTVFSVTADDVSVGMYSDKTYWDGCVNFGYFDMPSDHIANITVTPHFPFRSIKILPEILGITPQVTNGVIKFSVTRTPMHITVVFDGNYMSGNILHLFANPITEAPEVAEDTVIFESGYHDVRENGGAMNIEGPKTVYLAPGSVLFGGVRLTGKDIKIYGSGVIMTDSTCPSISFDGAQVDGLLIDGIIVHSHKRNAWNVHLYMCSDVSVNNFKILSTTYACTDGLDISNGRNVSVKNSFIRSCDDGISLKAFDRSVPVENIHIDRTIIWNDCNNAMVVGEESRAKYYNDISFTNIDVIFSYDDPQYHEQLDERSVMGIVLLDGVDCTNILWENVRVNKCERLAVMTFKDNFWFGTVKGDQTPPGKIEGVKIRNVRVFCDTGSKIANQIMLTGFDENKKVKDVEFNLIQIMGVEIDENYPRLVRNEFTENISVSKTL